MSEWPAPWTTPQERARRIVEILDEGLQSGARSGIDPRAEHDALIQAQMNRLTDLGSTLLQRNAALVALCEELLVEATHYAEDALFDAYRAKEVMAPFRERLEQLRPK